VPKQRSTGDRTILGRITKRGNRYLRMLFIQGARAMLAIEQSDQRQPNQTNNISHHPRASPDSTALTSRIEFPTMTGVANCTMAIN
jgi:transposase